MSVWKSEGWSDRKEWSYQSCGFLSGHDHHFFGICHSSYLTLILVISGVENAPIDFNSIFSVLFEISIIFTGWIERSEESEMNFFLGQINYWGCNSDTCSIIFCLGVSVRNQVCSALWIFECAVAPLVNPISVVILIVCLNQFPIWVLSICWGQTIFGQGKLWIEFEVTLFAIEESESVSLGCFWVFPFCIYISIGVNILPELHAESKRAILSDLNFIWKSI